MSEWTSLSCKTDTKERVKALQGEDEGQDDVLNRALDALEARPGPIEVDKDKKVHKAIQEAFSQHKYIESEDELPADQTQQKLNEIEELLKDMDVVSNNQRVLTRIDDLETELKTHFERELGR